MTEHNKDLTAEEQKEIKITFAPGCFDNFEGTQEELDELIAEIQKMANTGELFEQSRVVDVDQLFDEEPELAEHLAKSFMEENTPRRLN